MLDNNFSTAHIISQAPPITEAYDTTTPAFMRYVQDVETWYLSTSISSKETDQFFRSTLKDTIGFRIALKFAISRQIIREITQPVTITLLNPVYKETGRMQPRSQHPHGEDSIRHKINTLRELEKLNSNLTCQFIVIDDEDPDGSGYQAQQILNSEYPQSFATGKYRVLFLRDALDQKDPDLPPGLTYKDGPNRSVKGGALLFGMRKALKTAVTGLHVLVDNDADLSVHPMQLGLLLEKILRGKAKAVAGSRREADSVALIGGSRNKRGQLFIEIWKHLLPSLAEQVTDTNRAFKAFTADALSLILDGIRIYTFPYQVELLQACISHNIPLETVGIAYIDSEAASTQQGAAITETYLNQIHQIIDISQRYQALDPQDDLLRFFLNVSEQQWQAIETNPPQHLDELL